VLGVFGFLWQFLLNSEINENNRKFFFFNKNTRLINFFGSHLILK
jgi:hypothetical protein